MTAESETLNLDHSDNVASIRERLAGIRGKRVLLILPENGALFRRKLDLVLVQREAYRRAIQLALVSRDPQALGNARELNISCFDTLSTSQSERWKRGRQKVFLPRYHKPSAATQPEDLRSIASRVDARNRRRPRFWRYFERLAVLTLLIGVVGLAIYLIAPSAVVVVTLRPETVNIEIEVVADVNAATLDMAGAVVPAQRVEVIAEATTTVPTSGLRSLDDVTATGFVTFTNQTEESLVVPAATLLSTSAGEPVRFRTVAEAAVPAGVEQRAEAPIEALRSFSGNRGNVAAGMINIVVGPLQASVSVINLAPTSGGAARTAKIVDANDRDHLLESARAQLLTTAYEQISAELSNVQVIVIDSLRILEQHKDWTLFSAEVGEVANELTLTMRATVAAVVLDESLSRQVVMSRLRDQAHPGKIILAETSRYSRGPINWLPARDQARFVARAQGSVVTQVDTAPLREQLAGMTLADARAHLESTVGLAGGASTSIDVIPSSLNRMPSLPIRISLEVRMPT